MTEELLQNFSALSVSDHKNPLGVLNPLPDATDSSLHSVNWRCESCGNINYPRRVKCNRCNLVRCDTSSASARKSPDNSLHGSGNSCGASSHRPPPPPPLGLSYTGSELQEFLGGMQSVPPMSGHTSGGLTNGSVINMNKLNMPGSSNTNNSSNNSIINQSNLNAQNNQSNMNAFTNYMTNTSEIDSLPSLNLLNYNDTNQAFVSGRGSSHGANLGFGSTTGRGLYAALASNNNLGTSNNLYNSSNNGLLQNNASSINSNAQMPSSLSQDLLNTLGLSYDKSAYDHLNMQYNLQNRNNSNHFERMFSGGQSGGFDVASSGLDLGGDCLGENMGSSNSNVYQNPMGLGTMINMGGINGNMGNMNMTSMTGQNVNQTHNTLPNNINHMQGHSLQNHMHDNHVAKSFIAPDPSSLQTMILKAKEVADRLVTEFHSQGENEPAANSLEVLKKSLAMLGHAVADPNQNRNRNATLSNGNNSFQEDNPLQGIGGPHFSAPTMLAHPDEFKNPSSFLKIYGDPLCGSIGGNSPMKGQNGNWVCCKCQNVNFPRRFRCNKCSEYRDAEGDDVVSEYAKTVYHQHLRTYKALAARQGIEIPLKRFNNSASPHIYNTNMSGTNPNFQKDNHQTSANNNSNNNSISISCNTNHDHPSANSPTTTTLVTSPANEPSPSSTLHLDLSHTPDQSVNSFNPAPTFEECAKRGKNTFNAWLEHSGRKTYTEELTPTTEGGESSPEKHTFHDKNFTKVSSSRTQQSAPTIAT